MNFVTNKYVDFVSDEDFLKCVKTVCDKYDEIANNNDPKEFHKNALDVNKMVFDTANIQGDISKWIKSEKIRQADKTISNVIGKFHENLLGSVDNWESLPQGHETGVDIRRTDGSIYMELKNKHNTLKGENEKNMFEKLERVAENFTSGRVYFAYIIPKKGTNGEKLWARVSKSHPRVWEAWGSKVYEIVTGKPKSLEQMWNALPKAISEIQSSEFSFDGNDQKTVQDIFKHTLDRN